ncbi:type II secretion system F family protein [Alicyclobacillus acidocaldarius]|uniref:Type II secretion system protein GspF domain-containing protein n=1 Tax=Alicyclobacillus acidocaldarius (strain Tc-4-1) TaxID=1048834 RepID=F8IGK7_ALIAT|nr:hypothetical protein [Alicyclobacillus acidocaldarius]AEJ44287.1 hypothetical protein TC41_2387 [Alicyclobacillus acidocaldarius subsp. acidocaldarius Tc-4-1]
MLGQLSGVLMALAMLCFFIEADLRRAHEETLWLSSIRERYQDTSSKIQRFKALQRLRFEAQEAGIRMSALLPMAVFAFVALSVLLSFAEKSVLFGVLVSLGGTIAGAVTWIRSRYKKQKYRFLQSIVREAIPIVITTLRATDRLDEAFEDVARIARSPILRREFQLITQSWRGLRITPEQAFVLAASRWEIEEMVQLAKATEVATRYQADRAQLWLRFRDQIERDEDKRRVLRAKTLAGRRNGLIYAGIVLSMFGLVYPRAQAYMTTFAKDGFWITLLILIGCTWWIWRTGEVIEV